MSKTLASYSTRLFGEDCDYLDTPGEPCWGDVWMVDDGEYEDEDGEWHLGTLQFACAGHSDRVWRGGPYRPSTYQEDIDAGFW